MVMKYWKLKCKGEQTAENVQSAIGSAGGYVVRIHLEGGETTVYFSTEKTFAPLAAQAIKGAAKPEEVTIKEITKFK
jgi:hypothetical protein